MKKNIRLLYSLYGLSIVVIIIISTLFYNKFNSVYEYSEKAEETSAFINLIEKLKLELLDAENNQLNYLLTKSEKSLDPEAVVLKRVNTLLDTMQLKMDKSQDQYRTFIKLKSAINNRFMAMAEVWKIARSNGSVDYEKFLEDGEKAMIDFKTLSNKMEHHERETLLTSSNWKKHYASVAPIFLFLILGITTIFQVISFALILKESKKRYNYQQQLEQKIKDLNVTNAELEQIAFVASHDLQEPLRKIQTFSDRIIKKYAENLDEDGNVLLQRMNASSKRVQELMGDLVNYTSILQTEEGEKEVALSTCLNEVLTSLKLQIRKSKAVIKQVPLPVIIGHYNQVYMLFYNLLDNAIKFAKQGTTPIINISCEIVNEVPNDEEEYISGNYFKISINDNGIGFEKEYAGKIFIIFQRLHSQNSTYQGKGIGLAICKRVMMNHHGFITATGEPGRGATFEMYFPQKENR